MREWNYKSFLFCGPFDTGSHWMNKILSAISLLCTLFYFGGKKYGFIYVPLINCLSANHVTNSPTCAPCLAFKQPIISLNAPWQANSQSSHSCEIQLQHSKPCVFVYQWRQLIKKRWTGIITVNVQWTPSQNHAFSAPPPPSCCSYLRSHTYKMYSLTVANHNYSTLL